MEYKFHITEHDTYKWKYFNVKFKEDKYSILSLILLSDDWTGQKVQAIIDGIENSKTKEKGKEYYWGNEDVDIYANKNGILLIDKMSQRGGIHDPDIITLRLTHQEMIQFLKDFKTFIEENS